MAKYLFVVHYSYRWIIQYDYFCDIGVRRRGCTVYKNDNSFNHLLNYLSFFIILFLFIYFCLFVCLFVSTLKDPNNTSMKLDIYIDYVEIISHI